MPIYTLGYARWSVDEVGHTLETLDAALVDVRYNPSTSKPGFSRNELQARFPDRYLHVAAFGNVNYKGGPIQLADPERGLQRVEALNDRPVLMCGCRDPKSCHRSVVAERIAEEGEPIKHLRAPSEPGQPNFFDPPASSS